jgi:hypothetical protein
MRLRNNWMRQNTAEEEVGKQNKMKTIEIEQGRLRR